MAARSARRAHVQRHERGAACRGRRERVEQQPGLLRRARAQLDERLGPGRARRSRRRVRCQQGPLGAGRVVLGQPGDLLEQLAAAGVVEPLRRQLLRARRSARRGRRRAAPRSASSSVEVDVEQRPRSSVVHSVVNVRAAGVRTRVG